MRAVAMLLVLTSCRQVFGLKMTPIALVGPNAEGANDRDPWVSADERLVFSSDRGGRLGLYMSTR